MLRSAWFQIAPAVCCMPCLCTAGQARFAPVIYHHAPPAPAETVRHASVRHWHLPQGHTRQNSNYGKSWCSEAALPSILRKCNLLAFEAMCAPKLSWSIYLLRPHPSLPVPLYVYWHLTYDGAHVFMSIYAMCPGDYRAHHDCQAVGCQLKRGQLHHLCSRFLLWCVYGHTKHSATYLRTSNQHAHESCCGSWSYLPWNPKKRDDMDGRFV